MRILPMIAVTMPIVDDQRWRGVSPFDRKALKEDKAAARVRAGAVKVAVTTSIVADGERYIAVN